MASSNSLSDIEGLCADTNSLIGNKTSYRLLPTGDNFGSLFSTDELEEFNTFSLQIGAGDKPAS